MVRLYIELDKLKENERVAKDQISPEVLIAAANRITKPYTIEVKEVPWWSVYEIGQGSQQVLMTLMLGRSHGFFWLETPVTLTVPKRDRE